MNDARALRFAAVLIVLAGYVVVVRSGERRIADQLDANARLAARAQAAARGIASHAVLERERARLRERLRDTQLAVGRGALVERFLRDAAAATSSHRTLITAVAAGAGSAPATARANDSSFAARTVRSDAPRGLGAPASEPVEATPLDVTLEGRYADVLATVRELSRGRVPASVAITSVARKNVAPAAPPTVSALLRVVLERYAGVAPAQGSRVRARPV
ncbi:MAG TPA: hypothetical protein VGD01_02650 [Candidatus Elarobacter sp.]